MDLLRGYDTQRLVKEGCDLVTTFRDMDQLVPNQSNFVPQPRSTTILQRCSRCTQRTGSERSSALIDFERGRCRAVGTAAR
jgi:hypothetical protein